MDMERDLGNYDRYSKRLNQINDALKRLQTGQFGYCEITGTPIGLERLEILPFTSMSVEALELFEMPGEFLRPVIINPVPDPGPVSPGQLRCPPKRTRPMPENKESFNMTPCPTPLEITEPSGSEAMDFTRLMQIMDIKNPSHTHYAASLPFSPRDVTAGVENEFQTVVQGRKQNVDLAIAIENSNFYKNMLRRTASGDSPRKMMDALEELLAPHRNANWASSWVRLPMKSLNTYAHHIFNSDLKSDKTDPASKPRSDAGTFKIKWDGEQFIRVPVSYLLKLALADAMGEDQGRHAFIRITGEKMMAHFLNDNTSPETFSFYPVQADSSRGTGSLTARETPDSVCLHPAAGAVRPGKILSQRPWTDREGIFFGLPSPVAEKPQRRHPRHILPPPFHEPLSFRLEPGRRQARIHEGMSQGFEPQPHQQPAQIKGSRHNQHQSGHPSQQLQHKPCQQRHPYQHGQQKKQHSFFKTPLPGLPPSMKNTWGT